MKFSHCQDSDEEYKKLMFLSQTLAQVKKFSIETSMEEVKLVVTKEGDFEYQDKSILDALCGLFSDCQDFYARNKIHDFSTTSFATS